MPGPNQADLGEAVIVIAGGEQKAHFFVLDLPHSDACFVRAHPAATADVWMDGHVHAFAFFGGLPQSVLYDNDRCMVSTIQPDGTRVRAVLFNAPPSHYLFRDRYVRFGKGNDNGNVEGMVGYARRNHMVPIPRFPGWDAFNADLEAPAEARHGSLSLPSARQRRDDFRGQLHGADGRGGGMTAAPELLLAHRLKTLKLPALLHEHEKLARQCAAEDEGVPATDGVDGAPMAHSTN